MKTFKQYLQNRKEYYENIRSNIIPLKRNFIEGRLEISKSNKTTQYIYVTKKNGRKKPTRQYISKSNLELIRKLTYQSYIKKVDSLANKRLKQIERILKDYKSNEIDLLYNDLNVHRKNKISPIIPTYEQKVQEWKDIPCKGRKFSKDSLLIYTNLGERVRSKTEKIIADKLNSMSIQYKYEATLVIGGYTFYPDFTFIDPYTHKEIYWEHFGMMDDAEYVNNVINKLNLYQLNGIEIGKNLIVTFESSKVAVNEEVVNNIIEKHLIYKD